VFDLAPMFLPSSARNHLLTTEEKASPSSLISYSSLLVQLSRYDFYGLSLPRARNCLFLEDLVETPDKSTEPNNPE
jgi:hypothetical protein